MYNIKKALKSDSLNVSIMDMNKLSTFQFLRLAYLFITQGEYIKGYWKYGDYLIDIRHDYYDYSWVDEGGKKYHFIEIHKYTHKWLDDAKKSPFRYTPGYENKINIIKTHDIKSKKYRKIIEKYVKQLLKLGSKKQNVKTKHKMNQQNISKNKDVYNLKELLSK